MCVCVCVQMKDMTCRELVKEVAKMYVYSYKVKALMAVCDSEIRVRPPVIQECYGLLFVIPRSE